MAKTILDKLMARSKRNPDTGCLLWTGWLTDKGYGEIRVGRKKKRVHRVTWELAHGPVPPGFLVCHTCDVPNCRELDHLFLGTPADNTADMMTKGREFRPYGELAASAKLTDGQVREIYIAREPQRTIAARYGIGKSTVGAIKRGEAWRHITGL